MKAPEVLPPGSWMAITMLGLHTLNGIWDVGQEGLERAKLLAHWG